jgi:hypothetical protein
MVLKQKPKGIKNAGVGAHFPHNIDDFTLFDLLDPSIIH